MLLRSTLLGGAAALAMGAAPAMAQEEGEAQAAAQDTVVVTGSRITRSNLTASTPINTFNSAQIELSGATNSAEILRTLPAIGVSAVTSTNSNFFTQSSGVNTIDLRNLSEDRTLVLVNGRRFVAGLPGSATVDFNSIPTELIDRMEVVTGGASAIYGSDALAGVINVILKDDFDGVLVTGQAGISEEGDDESYQASATLGSDFDDGRGSAVASLTWSRSNGVYARDRAGRDTDGFSEALLGGDVEDWQNSVFPFFSSFSERGRIIVPGAASDFVFDETQGAARPYNSALDGFNRQGFRAIAVPTERFLFSSMVDYEVSEKLGFFFEGTYASTETSSTLEPFPLSSEDVYGDNLPQFVDTDGDGVVDRGRYGISILNPFVPAGIRDAARAGADIDGDGVQDIADEDLVVGFARRTTELDARGADNSRQTARFVFGAEGDLSEAWSYEASINLGRTTQMQRSTGQINVLNLRSALDVTTNADGEVVCASEIARAQGCVPVDIFGKGSISQAAADYIKAPSSVQATIEQQVYQGFLTGDLGFASPWASENVAVVLGAEYRVEASESIPDALSQAGLNAGNVSPPVIGDFAVAELFAETEIALVQGHRFAEDLRLNLSARASDYTTVGQTFAWAANMQYQPNELVRFRAQYAEAVRAPNIGELFQPLAETFEGGDDPCIGLTVNGAGDPGFLNDEADATSGVDSSTVNSDVAVACFSEPTLQDRIARDGAFVPSQAELQGIGGFNGGNPDLSEETATTITVGAILTPNFGNEWIDRFAVSVDYFNIEIDDAISGLGRQTSLDQCYLDSGGVLDPNSAFCSNVVRYQNGPFIGAINELNALQQNLATIATSGVDVQASYSMPVNDVADLFGGVESDLGQLNLTLTYGWLEKYEQEAFPGAEVIDYSDTAGLFEHEFLFGAVYTRGPLTVAYDLNYLPETRLDATGFFADAVVPAAAFQDIQVRYEAVEDAELVFGVDNITDEFIRYGGGLDSTGTFTDAAVYDAIGRRYYVGVRKRF
ncbi:MAG: TonB-dependent receptor domain-containing protein [Oceanicaulis sp.]